MSVRNFVMVLFGGGLLIGVSGCGLFGLTKGIIKNPKDDYLEARQENPLVVPPGLRDLADTDPFPIPATPTSPNPSFYPNRPPLPDAIYASDNREEVRIQRLGERRWLVLPEPPTTAWPKIKQFLAENGVPIALDAPQDGRLNTGWMQLDAPAYRDVIRSVLKEAKDEEGMMLGQDRFLMRVEQGLRPATTEVHVRHENDSVALPSSDAVVKLNDLRSHIAGAEADMLNEIGAYIAAKVSEQTVSKVALQIGSARKSEIARDEQGYPILRLFLDYERAWATLGQALDNANVEIVNLDRATGTFDVKLTDAVFAGEDAEDQGGGFFCRLTFSCGGSSGAYDLRLQVDIADADGYEVSVLEEGGGARAGAELAQQVLVLLREYAS
ncbi:MAG: outer membrane protein assembly factor BamC [Pseudomonadota bacterium]